MRFVADVKKLRESIGAQFTGGNQAGNPVDNYSRRMVVPLPLGVGFPDKRDDWPQFALRTLILKRIHSTEASMYYHPNTHWRALVVSQNLLARET